MNFEINDTIEWFDGLDFQHIAKIINIIWLNGEIETLQTENGDGIMLWDKEAIKRVNLRRLK